MQELKNCITLAFIGVLKHTSTPQVSNNYCITLAFIGVLKHIVNDIFGRAKLYHIGVYRGIKTCSNQSFKLGLIVSHWRL